MSTVKLKARPERLAVCRLDPSSPVPEWAMSSLFFSLTRTDAELSIVCREDGVPAEVTAARGWRALEVQGPLDFSLTGILASLAAPLAAAGISIFTISTYDTDYVLVRESSLPAAIDALRRAGHEVVPTLELH